MASLWDSACDEINFDTISNKRGYEDYHHHDFFNEGVGCPSSPLSKRRKGPLVITTTPRCGVDATIKTTQALTTEETPESAKSTHSSGVLLNLVEGNRVRRSLMTEFDSDPDSDGDSPNSQQPKNCLDPVETPPQARPVLDAIPDIAQQAPVDDVQAQAGAELPLAKEVAQDVAAPNVPVAGMPPPPQQQQQQLTASRKAKQKRVEDLIAMAHQVSKLHSQNRILLGRLTSMTQQISSAADENKTLRMLLSRLCGQSQESNRQQLLSAVNGCPSPAQTVSNFCSGSVAQLAWLLTSHNNIINQQQQ